MKIRLFAILRQIAACPDGQSRGGATVEVPQAEGDTLRTLLARLVDAHPDLGPKIFDGDGQLQSHIHVIVNGRDVRFLAGLDTVVQANDQILIFPPVGGGTSGAIQSS
jgi:molybdopterin synthase sulfur carrier subunit